MAEALNVSNILGSTSAAPVAPVTPVASAVAPAATPAVAPAKISSPIATSLPSWIKPPTTAPATPAPTTPAPTVTVQNSNMLQAPVGQVMASNTPVTTRPTPQLTPQTSPTDHTKTMANPADFAPVASTQKEIKLTSTDPDFENKAAAISMQRQQEKALTDLAQQQQAARSQFTQQLQDSGQRGSTLATLQMLKDREFNSALNTLDWEFTNNYLDWLSTQQDKAESESKASFTADINNALSSGNTDGAMNLIKAVAELYPEDSHFQAMLDPAYAQEIIKSYDPQVQTRKNNAVTSALTLLKERGDIMDDSVLAKNSTEVLQALRNGYSRESLQLGANTMTDADLQAYAEEFYPTLDFSASGYPQSLREDAFLMNNFKRQVNNAQDEYATTVAEGITADLKTLNPATVNTVKKSLQMLMNKDGGSISLEGVNVPADYFTDLDSGASSIFTTDWDGDSDFGNRQPEYDALDQLWLYAVKENRGDFTMEGADPATLRDAFADYAFEAASEYGISDLRTATPAQLKALWDSQMKDKFQPNGAFQDLSAAARSGDPDTLYTQLMSVQYENPQDAYAIQQLAQGLKEAGQTVSWPPSKADDWTKTPGVYWSVVPLGQGMGQGLVQVKVAEPSWNKDLGMWETNITASDPSGYALLGDTENFNFGMTSEEAGLENPYMKNVPSWMGGERKKRTAEDNVKGFFLGETPWTGRITI